MPFSAEHITNIHPKDFEEIALETFYYQANHLKVYNEYLSYLKFDSKRVKQLMDIPFLPIQFFKHHTINSATTYQQCFESSGTTGSINSKHYIHDTEYYFMSLRKAFEQFYGSPENYIILGLLPSYLERNNASLSFMVKHLMDLSNHPSNGFFLDNYEELVQRIEAARSDDCKVILFGVSFALWELAEQFKSDWNHVIVIETGGMKGRRKEITREELHSIITSGIHPFRIDSEYGMTELLSQSFKIGSEGFKSPAWKKVLLFDMTDPFQIAEAGRNGRINVIDLANQYSCSFIQTNDIGKYNEDGSFEVLGRMDFSDIRGCNLMFEG